MAWYCSIVRYITPNATIMFAFSFHSLNVIIVQLYIGNGFASAVVVVVGIHYTRKLYDVVCVCVWHKENIDSLIRETMSRK